MCRKNISGVKNADKNDGRTGRNKRGDRTDRNISVDKRRVRQDRHRTVVVGPDVKRVVVVIMEKSGKRRESQKK